MNTHLTYLMVQEKTTAFARHAAQARLSNQVRTADSPRAGGGWAGRAVARFRLRAAGRRTDAVVEREHPFVAG